LYIDFILLIEKIYNIKEKEKMVFLDSKKNQQGDDTDYDEDLVEYGGGKIRRTRRNKTIKSRRNKSKIRKSKKHRKTKSRRHRRN